MYQDLFVFIINNYNLLMYMFSRWAIYIANILFLSKILKTEFRNIWQFTGISPHDGVRDMILISDIDEDGICTNLQVRYNKDIIYVSFFWTIQVNRQNCWWFYTSFRYNCLYCILVYTEINLTFETEFFVDNLIPSKNSFIFILGYTYYNFI